MPHLTLASWIIWIIVIVSQLALCLKFGSGELRRRWRSLFLFLLVNTSESVILLILVIFPFEPAFAKSLYFYVFWGGTFISYIVELFMIAEIATDVAAITPKISQAVKIGVACIAFCCVAFSLFLHGFNFPVRLTEAIDVLDRVLSFGWFLTFVVVTVGVDFIGFKWPRQTVWLSTGFFIETCGSWVCAFVLTPNNAHLLSAIKGGIYLAALAVWACSTREVDESAFDAPDLKALRFSVGVYISVLKRLGK